MRAVAAVPAIPDGFPRIPLVITALVLCLLPKAGATIINVPADQPTIQAGIDLAATGDTVLVAPGYYLENIDFRGKEIVVSSHFLLSSDPAFIFSTTIDGSDPYESDSASTVRIFCSGDEAPVFQGFTVTGGGGTLMQDPTEGSINRNGGGIATRLGAPLIRFNYIHHNQPNAAVTVAGGGVYLQLGNPTVENNIIVNNPGRNGCGLCVRAATAVADNNVIAYNAGGATFGGAGIYLYQGRLDGRNNTIAYNSSLQPGGAIRVAGATISLRNSIVWGNQAADGQQMYVASAYGGTILLEYSDVEGGYAGTENINFDPAFSEPWLVLGAGSPCIDAGDPDPAFIDNPWPSAPEAARWPSHGGLRNDLGAYGGPGGYPFELAVIRTDATVGWVPWPTSFEAESFFEADNWNWSFGDGEEAQGQTAAHTFEVPGAFDVALSVVHDGGADYCGARVARVYALADTMWVDDSHLTPSGSFQQIEVIVEAHNSIPLREIWIPVAYSGSLALIYDGFSTEGCRTAGFERQVEDFDNPANKTALIQLSGDSDLPPGSGPVLKLIFFVMSAGSGQTATVALDGEPNPSDPIFSYGEISFVPATRSGTIQCGCCSGRTGDANGSGEDVPTIGDISVIIDAKFITGECVADGSGANIRCLGEADVNLSGGASPTCDDITVGDISMLIDCLFITGEPPFERNECAQ